MQQKGWNKSYLMIGQLAVGRQQPVPDDAAKKNYIWYDYKFEHERNAILDLFLLIWGLFSNTILKQEYVKNVTCNIWRWDSNSSLFGHVSLLP